MSEIEQRGGLWRCGTCRGWSPVRDAWCMWCGTTRSPRVPPSPRYRVEVVGVALILALAILMAVARAVGATQAPIVEATGAAFLPVEIAPRLASPVPSITDSGAPLATRAPQASAPPLGPRAFASARLGSTQYLCLAAIVAHEDGTWDPTRTNATSGAYGIPQALPGSKMASAGADWRTNPVTQVRWMISYVEARYGSPCDAWTFWLAHGWY